MNKISKEDYEKALNDAMKRHEESKSRTTILDRLSGAIDERFSRIEACIKGKSSKRGLVEEVPKPISNLDRQAQDSELAKAIQEKPLTCTTCGSANPASAIYCWNCKTSLIRPVVKEEFTGAEAKVEEELETPRLNGDAKTHLDALKLISCPKCGSENLALAPFCYNCKARLATLNDNLEKSEPIIKS
jgi:ribosomal protein L40E